jgi:hypothetical protein
VIERIDHLVAVVEDFDSARRAWVAAGCPVVWDGRSREHRSACFSIGAINLEMLSKEAFDDWSALADWRRWTGRQFGLHAVAFDPGDLDATVHELREAGIELTEPRDGRLDGTPAGDPQPSARWRNSYAGDLSGLLPGLPSFLCEFVTPHLGRAPANSPVRFVELRVGLPDPEAGRERYERLLGPSVHGVDGAILLRPGDTPIRLVRGVDLSVLLEARSQTVSLDDLAAAVPGIVRFDDRSAAPGPGNAARPRGAGCHHLPPAERGHGPPAPRLRAADGRP